MNETEKQKLKRAEKRAVKELAQEGFTVATKEKEEGVKTVATVNEYEIRLIKIIIKDKNNEAKEAKMRAWIEARPQIKGVKKEIWIWGENRRWLKFSN